MGHRPATDRSRCAGRHVARARRARAGRASRLTRPCSPPRHTAPSRRRFHRVQTAIDAPRPRARIGRDCRGRPTRDQDRAPASSVEARRATTAVERGPRRHALGGSTPRGPALRRPDRSSASLGLWGGARHHGIDGARIPRRGDDPRRGGRSGRQRSGSRWPSHRRLELAYRERILPSKLEMDATYLRSRSIRGRPRDHRQDHRPGASAHRPPVDSRRHVSGAACSCSDDPAGIGSSPRPPSVRRRPCRGRSRLRGRLRPTLRHARASTRPGWSTSRRLVPAPGPPAGQRGGRPRTAGPGPTRAWASWPGSRGRRGRVLVGLAVLLRAAGPARRRRDDGAGRATSRARSSSSRAC